MNMRIIRKNVNYCATCNDVREMKLAWDKDQEDMVENGQQDDIISFQGVPGYVIKDADDYSYLSTEICEVCMQTVTKGVNLINSQHLTGISLNNGR